MPIVPTLQTSVRSTALPSARLNIQAPIEGFGGGKAIEPFAEASQGLLKQAGEIALQEKKIADDSFLKSSYAKAQMGLNKLYGDPETGVISRKGENAIGVFDEFNPKVDALFKDLLEEASNEEQRRSVMELKGRMGAEFDNDLHRHLVTERKAVDKQSTEAAIGAAQNSAELYWYDPVRVKENIKRQVDIIEDHAMKEGMPKEVSDFRVVETVSQTHANVTNRMLSAGAYDAAADYFKQNEAMFGKHRKSIAEAVDSGIFVGKSQAATNMIMAKSGGDLEVARSFVKEIKDPKLQDEVDARVQKEFKLIEQYQTANRDKDFLDSLSVVEKTGNVDDVPRSTWNSLLAHQRNALEAAADRRPGAHKDDVYLKYMGMSAAELSAVSEADLLSKVRPNLAEQYFKEVAHKWSRSRESIHRGDKNADKEIKSIDSDQNLILNRMSLAGLVQSGALNPSDIKITAQKKRYMQLKEAADNAFIAYQYDNGGKIPNADVKKNIVDGLIFNKVYIDRSFMPDDEVSPYEISPDQVSKSYIPIDQIPITAQRELVNMARSASVISEKVSDEVARQKLKRQIEKAYARHLMGGSTEALKQIMSEEP